MTATCPTTALRPVVHDLYRDIHKGIRAELFTVTLTAGRLDPADRSARAALAEHVGRVVELLVSHAEHEDGAVQPELERHLPDLAERIEVDHLTLEARLDQLEAWAIEASDAGADDRRQRSHSLYVELGSFTSAYLEHQDFEERVVMPALEDVLGADAVIGIHEAIVGAIPPDELAKALAVMLPAMNLEDRAELLGGMQADAPAEVFQGVWALATDVLGHRDREALAGRLGLAA